MTSKVILTRAEIDYAHELAHESYKRFAQHDGHYRNTPRSHIVGKLGEVAVTKYFASLLPSSTIQPHYSDPTMEAQCDLTVDQARIEVKTWSHEYWHELGRCVAAAQMETVQRKADLIVWCSEQSGTVFIHGWNTPNEVASVPPVLTGPPHRQVLNHQVALNQMQGYSGGVAA